jgi:SAM-dependent methyltransferase
MTGAAYVGTELTIFREAVRWKAYWRGEIARYLRGAVLEVGAGIGANTAALATLARDRWICLEPDPALASRILLPSLRHEVVVGTIGELPLVPTFDTILYLDVLEHIEDDHGELLRAAGRLNPGGTLIVLAPGHQFLFSPFDRAIGHFRRYDRRSLRACVPAGLQEKKLVYLDSCGLVASLGNRLFLRSAEPNQRQILAWDTFLVPCSRWLDPMLSGRLGKSVLGVWSASPPLP